MAQLGFWGLRYQGFGVLGAGILEGLAAWGLKVYGFRMFWDMGRGAMAPICQADATPPEPVDPTSPESKVDP